MTVHIHHDETRDAVLDEAHIGTSPVRSERFCSMTPGHAANGVTASRRF